MLSYYVFRSARSVGAYALLSGFDEQLCLWVIRILMFLFLFCRDWEATYGHLLALAGLLGSVAREESVEVIAAPSPGGLVAFLALDNPAHVVCCLCRKKEEKSKYPFNYPQLFTLLELFVRVTHCKAFL